MACSVWNRTFVDTFLLGLVNCCFDIFIFSNVSPSCQTTVQLYFFVFVCLVLQISCIITGYGCFVPLFWHARGELS
jgi:hypothetical protein